MEENKRKTFTSPSAPSSHSDLASPSDCARSRSAKRGDRGDDRLRCTRRRQAI